MLIARVARFARRYRESRLVRTNSYWDSEWYLANNPDVRSSGADPFQHYMRHGCHELRSPGPRFDAYGYWLLNPSSSRHPLVHYLRRFKRKVDLPPPLKSFEKDHPVLSSGLFDADWYRSKRMKYVAEDVHPYIDYVHYGEHAGIPPSRVLDLSSIPNSAPVPTGFTCHLDWIIRTARLCELPLTVVSKAGTATGGRPVIAPRVGQTTSSNSRILAYVHAHYVDLLPEVLAHVAHMPPDSTVVVVVPSKRNVREAENLIDAIVGTRVRRHVHVSPNRGRNFGPFVSNLAPVVMEHDIVLHLHTKKSMYTGRERDEWREHLYSTLAGSKRWVETIIGLFEDDPTIGVVSASTHESLPHWAHHWLSNVPIGRQLYTRLGIDPSLVAGPVDYPVGGMFWARTEALRPLFEAGYTIGDFAEEPAPNDGTLAHAIERSIYDIARSRGFSFVEIDPHLPQWRLDWSARIELPERFQIDTGIWKSVVAARLVTVDLFDTLVLRPSLDPSTLQHLAAERVGRRLGLEPEDVLSWRIEAESKARSNVPGDVDLSDISSACSFEQRFAVEAQLDAEVAMEDEVCIPRTWLIDTLRRAKRRDQIMLVMSDTYLPRSCIDGLLRRIGASDIFDDVLISNQIRHRKDSGTMWTFVEQAYGIPRSEWVHIGDNEFSDVQQPVDRGISAVHVPSPSGVANGIGISKRRIDSEKKTGTDLVLGLSAIGAFEELSDSQGRRSDAFRFGWSGLGPLIWAYVTWLINHPATKESQHLLFLARDGDLPMKVLNTLRPFVPESVPPASYVLTSRRSAISIGQANGPRLDLLLSGGDWTGSLRELVRVRIGLELPRDPSLDIHIELPGDLDQATRWLTPYADSLVERGRRDLQAFLAYFRKLGIGDEASCVIADLGYSGTIQRCFEEVLPQKFIGLYAATTPRARACAFGAHGLFGEDVSWPDDRNTILDNGLLLESLWQSDHGQVDRIVHSRDGIQAQLRWRDPISDFEHHELLEARDGAVAFCREVVEMFGPEIIDMPIDQYMAMAPFAHLVSGSVPWSNRVLAHLTIDNDFTGLGQSRVRPIPD